MQYNAAGQLELKLKTPWLDATSHLAMSPQEFMQRVAALVPRLRLYLIRLHDVLAPNAKLRPTLALHGPVEGFEAAKTAECLANCARCRPVRLSRARLPKRVFEIGLKHCQNSGVS